MTKQYDTEKSLLTMIYDTQEQVKAGKKVLESAIHKVEKRINA